MSRAAASAVWMAPPSTPAAVAALLLWVLVGAGRLTSVQDLQQAGGLVAAVCTLESAPAGEILSAAPGCTRVPSAARLHSLPQPARIRYGRWLPPVRGPDLI